MSKETISKQDRQGVRTASELERRWKFGKTFAEVMGMADDAQRAAEEAERAAEEASKELDALDQDAIFNLLTKGGELKGLFMKDGKLYVNASYLATGVIKSENGKLVIDLSGGTMPTFNTGISTNGLVVRADEADAQKLINIQAEQLHNGAYYGTGEFFSTNGKRLVYLVESFNNDYSEPIGVGMVFYDQNSTKRFKIVTGITSGIQLENEGDVIGTLCVNTDGLPVMELKNSDLKRVVLLDVNNLGGDLVITDSQDVRSVRLTDNGSAMGVWLTAAGATKGSFLADANGSQLNINKINGKTVSWKDNGDGTCTLIGE